MKRRMSLTPFLAVLIAAQVTAVPHSSEPKRIGWLSAGTRPVAGANPALSQSATEVEAFFEALKSHGWIEGRNVIVERRYAGGKAEQLPRLAAELVALKVDVIHATSGTAALAAKNATGNIPIVALSGDMVAQGLVSNLARPDANVTGQNMMLVEIAGKRLDLLRELLPRASRIAVFGCGPGTNMGISWPYVEAANKSLKFQLFEYTPQTEGEVRLALNDASSKRVDGLLVLDSAPRDLLRRGLRSGWRADVI
jgi:putative ABC transport system substrate-binding protein